MNTKTIISGSGKNLVGMEWSNLLDDYCPKCDGKLTRQSDYHYCNECDFRVTAERFSELITELNHND